jgi:Uma2 family endonuclease
MDAPSASALTSSDAPADARVSPTDYLRDERARPDGHRHEYIDGNVISMAGASLTHNRIVANLVRTLGNALIGAGDACEVVSQDLRVRTSDEGLYAYPDVVVVCGEPELADEQGDVLLNPTLLVEVLSSSTRDYDRGEKYERYRTLASLREYVTIEQRTPHVEHHARRADGGWLLTETRDLGATVRLASIGATITLADIYRRVTFAAA